MNDEPDLTDAQLLRENAEKELEKTQNKTILTSIETDVKRIVHELQVHQIELKMQNEELNKANEKAEAALKKYTMMYDFAPMGYFTLDQNGIIYELNFTGADMLGLRRFSLINSNLKLFISEETLPLFNDLLRRIYLGKSKQSCELMLKLDTDRLLAVYMEGIITREDNKCLLSLVDITWFKK